MSPGMVDYMGRVLPGLLGLWWVWVRFGICLQGLEHRVYRTHKMGSQIFTSLGDGGANTLVVTHAVSVGGGVGRPFPDLLGSSVWE